MIAFDRTFDYAKLNTALQAVRRRRPADRATNPDRTCPTEDGRDSRLRWHDGRRRGGDRAHGRGHRRQAVRRSSLEVALERLGVEARECAIVGDRIETDIVMGKRLGLATVLVLTGITAAGDARIADTAPDLVVPSIRDLVTS